VSSPESLSKAQIGQKLKIPLSTCSLRIQQLEKSGIIAGYTYVVDFSKLGLQAYSLLLATKSHTTALTKRILNFCQSNPEVVYLTENIGAFDYKVGVHLFTPALIIPFQQLLANELGDELVTCTALTAYDYLKVARYPFKLLPRND
jgi:DNA-binding Lrp family transcriptional regulator